jgi:hypothetical protein
MTNYIDKSPEPFAVHSMLRWGLTSEGYPTGVSRRGWMVHEAQDHWPLVADRQFILATRDTGYRSISAAVSELVDNALQADADCVQVFVREVRGDAELAGTPKRTVSLAVLDNGSGMSAVALRTALQFGGSERFNDRTGAGRFGMGLPNSSVSQSRRLELYSWRDGTKPLFSYLDVGEIARGTMREVPETIESELPGWVQIAVEVGDRFLPASGTLVVWPECDRVPYRKASTICAKLFEALGRTHRYAIRDGVCIFVNGDQVAPVDPLMEWGNAVEKYGNSAQHGDELRYEFKVPTEPSRTSVVRVRFTVLPVRRWARLPLEVRRALGIIGAAGVSIVRAGREVDYGWHFMGAKRRENYDDWWRCEIRFEPELDEYFGVTHSKQGIAPHPALQDALGADLEQIARVLNSRIRSEFLRLAGSRSADSGGVREELFELATDSGHEATKVARERERFLPPAGHRIRRFRIAHAPLASARFFIVTLKLGELVVTLNSEHPLYSATCDADVASQALLYTLLLAAARGEVVARGCSGSVPADQFGLTRIVADSLEHFFEAWSDALAAYLSCRS